MKLYVITFVLMLVMSCSFRKDTAPIDGQIIRTFNLKAVYTYLYEQTPGTSELMEKYRFFKTKLSELEKSKGKSDESLRKHYLEEIDKIESRNDIIKEKILNLVKRNVRQVSIRNGYDIVLNGDTSVLYSRNTFDITSEILQEIKQNVTKNSLIWK